MIHKKDSFNGRLALFAATLIWGTSFVVLKSTLDSVGVLTVLAVRFLAAAFIMALPTLRFFRGAGAAAIKSGALMGVLLFLSYIFQTYGLASTTPGKNAFLTSAYCIIVPFLCWLLRGARPDRYNVAAALICVSGVGMVSLDSDLSMNPGDGLTLVCGIFFAFHIIVTDRFAGRYNILVLTVTQMATAGLLSIAGALIFEPVPPSIPSGAVLPLMYLCLMCTGVCFFLQTYGQKRTSPASASVIMTFESVFGAALSVLTGSEELSPRLFIGFGLIFLAVLISETKLEFLRCRRAGRSGGLGSALRQK